jgi:hypothetical protein
MAIKIAGTTVIDDSRNVNVGILTATRLGVPPVPITFSPAIGSTGVAIDSNIIITHNRPVSKGTGNITLRSGSAGGTVLQTIGVTSTSVTISGGAVTIDPPANIGLGVTIFVVVDAGAFSGLTTISTSALIDTYSFTTKSTVDLGDSYEGGYLLCKASPLRWVVSPYSAEVGRNWYYKDEANTRAQAVSGCTGWFVPTCGQLQNPGYLCRSFWGPSPCYSSTSYWSSTEFNASGGTIVRIGSDNSSYCVFKNTSLCVRSFRCVTY